MGMLGEINLFKCSDLEECSKAVISSISPLHKDLSENHLVIVPDRYSLVTENMIFDVLNISSTFNINVRGISGLAEIILEEQNIKSECISKQQGLLLVRKAIADTSSEFKCFGKHISMGFVEEIYESISQLKSSEVTLEKLEESSRLADGGLKEKLNDLFLIYKRYEELLGDKLDSSRLLQVLDKILEKSEIIKRSRFYFVGFDSLTKQGYKIIESLAKYAKSLSVGVVTKNNKQNSFLFDEELFKRIEKLALENNIIINIKEVAPKKSKLQQHIAENAFVSKPNTVTNEKMFELCEVPNISGEIENLICNIKMLVSSGNKFKDINIACNLNSYEFELTRALNMAGFPYFFDSELSLAETSIAKGLVALLSFLENKFYVQNFLDSLKYDFFDIDDGLFFDIDNNICKFGLVGNAVLDIKNYEFESVKTHMILGKFLTYDKMLKSGETVFDYINAIKFILEDCNIQEKIENICQKFESKNDLKNEKLYRQVYDAIISVCDSFDITSNEKCTFTDFLDLFIFALTQKKLSNIPLSTDAIFIGDYSKSFYESKKYLFALGANQNSLPPFISDCGVISDEDISKLERLDIGPSVEMINRRNRFKVYDTFLKATDTLFVSYLSINDEGKNAYVANFVQQLLLSFVDENGQPTKRNYYVYKNIYLPDADEKTNFEKLKLNLINLKQAKLQFVSLNKLNYNHAEKSLLYSAIKKLDKDFEIKPIIKTNKKDLIEDAKRLFFHKGYTKISQLEKYFDCPYKHFMDYGLRLQDRETNELDARVFGNILHAVAEHFMRQNKNKLGEMTSEEIAKSAEYFFERELEKEEYKKFLTSQENKITLKLLKKEALKFCDALSSQQKSCDFIPTYFERRFEGEGFTLNDVALKIKGAIDRIDIYENYFRIIDYKSGKINDSLSALYYGSKVQLFIYARLAEKELNKKCAGILYLSAKDKFESKKEKPFEFKGLVVNDFSTIRHMDTNLSPENPKSTTLGVSISMTELKKGEVKLNSKGTANFEQIEDMKNYAHKICEKGCDEIMNGNIDVSPTKDSCKYCKYSGACGFSSNLNNRERKLPAIKSKDVFVVEDKND